MGLRYDEIGEILKLIDSSACDEFILETQDVKLVIKRQGANASLASPASAPFNSPSASSTPAAPAPQAKTLPAGTTSDGVHAVLSPMVGTFYRSPSPSEPPFVEVGAKVSKGDPIAIIEVMKLFTTIHAEWDGNVTEIGAENAQLVEYGQMLFVITPN